MKKHFLRLLRWSKLGLLLQWMFSLNISWFVYQLDYGSLSGEVHADIPAGCSIRSEGKVFKLIKKSLFKLKQASKNWN